MESDLFFNITNLGPIISDQLIIPKEHELSINIHYLDSDIQYICYTINNAEHDSIDTNWIYPTPLPFTNGVTLSQVTKDMNSPLNFIIGLSSYLSMVDLSTHQSSIVPEIIIPFRPKTIDQALDPDLMTYVAEHLADPNIQIFMFREVTITAIDFVAEFHHMFKKTIGIKVLALENIMKSKLEIQAVADMAMDDIDRKLSNSLDDIQYATSRLEGTGKRLVAELDQAINQHVETFNEQLGTIVVNHVQQQMTNEVDPRIASFDDKIKQLNDKLDRIIRCLNIH